jgi:SAM-dependent methyltransferase
MSDSNRTELAHSWDTFWRGTGAVGAFSSGGVAHPDIAAFWHDFFTSVASRNESIQLLDVATGNGALLETALSILDDSLTAYTCVDISEAAIQNIERRFPGVVGVVTDALSIPLEDKRFDLVTSQFGVEYAGMDAIGESARLVANGGQLVLMLHFADGVVHKECQASLEAIEKLQTANFIPLATAFFDTGFAAVRGADRLAYDAAGTQLSAAIRVAEDIMTEYGEGVAGGTIERLYSDVGRIHSNLPKYEPDEVLGWLASMERELQAYARRMSSMMGAAITEDAFSDLCGQLTSSGFSLDRSEPLLTTGQASPLAWILVARR